MIEMSVCVLYVRIFSVDHTQDFILKLFSFLIFFYRRLSSVLNTQMIISLISNILPYLNNFIYAYFSSSFYDVLDTTATFSICICNLIYSFTFIGSVNVIINEPI